MYLMSGSLLPIKVYLKRGGSVLIFVKRGAYRLPGWGDILLE